VQYREQGHTVHGVIDRLVVADDHVHLVDYKSHRLDNIVDAAQLATQYRPQMRLYREAVERLWPQHRVSCYLLLTADSNLVELP
jgi:ATP-dependent helicase/nuclease subunit A